MNESDDACVLLAIGNERELFKPEVRSSADSVERLLDPEFREIGASGRLWGRNEMLTNLLSDRSAEPGVIRDEDMVGERIADDLVLLTYISDAADRRARRTSIWRRSENHEWRLLHHQGTPLEN